MSRVLAVTLLLSLAACDSGGVVDQTVREGVRQSGLAACTAWVPQSDIVRAAGVDTDRLCGCAADRILEGKRTTQLADFKPSSAELRAAVAQCVAEVQTGAKGAGR